MDRWAGKAELTDDYDQYEGRGRLARSVARGSFVVGYTRGSPMGQRQRKLLLEVTRGHLL